LAIVDFDQCERGTLVRLLLNSYGKEEQLVARYQNDWHEFDSFVFTNLFIMNRCGFVTVEQNEPIGFISWDPRLLPDSVEMGHNCIIPGYQNVGKGKEQLLHGLQQIELLNPAKVVVKTGHSSFFLPARKMYESVGFSVVRKLQQDDPVVSTVIEYEMHMK